MGRRSRIESCRREAGISETSEVAGIRQVLGRSIRVARRPIESAAFVGDGFSFSTPKAFEIVRECFGWIEESALLKAKMSGLYFPLPLFFNNEFGIL